MKKTKTKEIDIFILKVNYCIIIFILFLGELMASSLPKHYLKTLENGLQIIVIPMENNSNVITTNIFYKVGSRNEIMGKSGIAHMLEHMNFKSTKNLEAGEFDKIVKSKGAVNNASTSFDYTNYYIQSNSENIYTSFKMFSELMENLNLKNEEFQIERDVVAEERRVRTDNPPIGYLYFRLFNTHYVSHSYHWTPIGFMNDIQNWTIDDIKNFHKKYYQPNNAILVVAGDIKKDIVFQEADKYFSKIKNRVNNIEPLKLFEPKRDGPIRKILHKENNKLDTIAIAFPIPNFEHKDQIILSLISEILSRGNSGRLNQEIVEKKEIANSIYAYNMELKDDAIFIFLGVTNPNKKIEDLESAIYEEIDKIKNEYIKEAELNKIKINTKSDFIFSLEKSSTISHIFGEYSAKGNLDPLLNYEEDLKKIKLEDIKRVANLYFDKNKTTTIILRKHK